MTRKTIIGISILIGVLVLSVIGYIVAYEVIYKDFRNEAVYRKNVKNHITTNNTELGLNIKLRLKGESIGQMKFVHTKDGYETTVTKGEEVKVYIWEDDTMTEAFEGEVVISQVTKEEYLSMFASHNLNLDVAFFGITFGSLSLNAKNNYVIPAFEIPNAKGGKISFEFLNLEYEIKKLKLQFRVQTNKKENMRAKNNVYRVDLETDKGTLEIIVEPFWISNIE